ncbi:hypothetical protein DL95DRAFT_423724 [Leptodontidium sp. 2 PMI_412]|nr:hypothetical protein DL95DRAFT_423724 [Leptodontidium sp. 2 PMI_412]
MDDDQQDFDNVAWDRNDEAWQKTLKRLRTSATCLAVESLAGEKCGKRATLVTPLMAGGYNMLYRMRLEETSIDDVLLRISCPGRTQFPHEKTLAEVGTMKCVKDKTSVPIPCVYEYGLSNENPDIGPFIIMPYIKNVRSLSEALNDPKNSPDEPDTLDPDIREEKLEYLYGQMAGYLLQLSQQRFSRIGSIVPTKQDSYSVVGRPISVNMNNMIRLANIPPAVLPPEGKTFKSADEWYIALAEMHMAQLVFQHNDLISTPDDCRNKYVARQLFWRLAKEGRLSIFGFADDDWSAQSTSQRSGLSPAPSEPNSFRLWCDDLRAGNILLNENDSIVAIIDWEFSYAGPAQFALDPPWWLLLEQPERWPNGIDKWREIYDRRLKTWLRVMEMAEERSWETGRFWLNYAARKSWAFDSIYWKYLDERFFVSLLTSKERKAMKLFVERKMVESKDRILYNWDAKEAESRLAEVLFEDDPGILEDAGVCVD